MVPKLLLTLTLWASCMSCGGSEDPSLQVQCRASRYPVSIDCSWTQSPAPNATTPTELITTYRLGMENKGENKPCLQQTPGSTSCTILDFMMFSTVPHVLNVTAIHPSGVTTALLPFVPEQIIKPDPPEAVHLNHIPGNQLQVQWDPPHTWPFPNVFRLKYQIRYKRCKSKRFWQVGPTGDTTFTLKFVRPHVRYCIQVNSQNLIGYGESSDWSLPATSPLTPGN
ncbi:PREDICTED: interleukin-27 subunit beta [Elephantulus edwardii]|uniref:interleukin-27 subunit beta n=1 Tax=Elephantulus edwardii TaxID=28737 RepID=UPI0003F0A9F3|nr:PREDICTED: interleukin-27 subunit beta [Elephantulus edwardii]